MTAEREIVSPWSQESTHSLTADDSRVANRAVVEAALPYADAVSVCLDIEWLDEDLPDVGECEAAYERVRDRFESLETDRWDRDSPQFRAPLPEASETVEQLVALDGICGRHFVFGLAFRRAKKWVYFTIPHHNWTAIDADWDGGSTFLLDVSDALAPLPACMVPDETRIEWEQDERRYSVRGSSICVSTLDEMRTACHGFTSVDSVVVEDGGHRVKLEYPEHDEKQGFVRRLLGSLADRLIDIPDRFEFEDSETGREFARIIRETLAAYRPATEP